MHTATVESPPKAAATAAFPDTPHLVPASLQEPLSQPAIAEAAAISFDPAQLAEEFRNFDAKSSALALAVKRALDIVVSASLLLLVLPVFAAIAALIKSSDGGPVFFLQKRVGFHGQIFPMLKFRSMVVHAERLKPPLELCNESSGPVFKMKRDPRVVMFGEDIADQATASFRIFTMSPSNAQSHNTWTAVGPASNNGGGEALVGGGASGAARPSVRACC